MPAVRLDGTFVAISKYDVVGKDSTGTPGFVVHVGLAGERRYLFEQTDELPLIHMRPPLEIGTVRYTIDCVGTADLTGDEVQRIGLFLDEVESEYEAARLRSDRRRQYVIAPHIGSIRAPDGTVICHRFSCAGLVIESYREVGIQLLRTDANDLPAVPLEVLIRQYPELASLLQNPRVRDTYGIPGDGPWPGVMAGYVMNALDRSGEEIRGAPHAAATGDEFFPSRRVAPVDTAS